MRITVSKSDLQSGPIKQIAKALAKEWPTPLTYMQAADKVALLLGYRNFHDMQQLAEPAASSRLRLIDIRKDVLLALLDALPDEVLPGFQASALLRSLPLHLLDIAGGGSPVEKTLTRPGAVEVLRALIDEAGKPKVQQQGKMFVVPITNILEREDIAMEEEELGEMLNYLIQTPVRFQQSKEKWIAFSTLSAWFIEANGVGNVHFEFSPHLMTFYFLQGLTNLPMESGVVEDKDLNTFTDERSRLMDVGHDNDADVDENSERPQ